MKSRQFIWLLLFSTALNLNSFAFNNLSEDNTVLKKVFILIRSEENQNQLAKFKEQINQDLAVQNVSAEFATYRKSEPLPQAKIFQKAYSGDYDILLLIEQVARYSLDNRVTNTMIKMGGKYKIQTYNLKEATYSWEDHGNSNCNISVDMSLKAFTHKILESIDINPGLIPDKVGEVMLASTDNSAEIYEQRRLYNELLVQVEKQKKKTRRLLFQIERLKSKLKMESKSNQFIALSELER